MCLRSFQTSQEEARSHPSAPMSLHRKYHSYNGLLCILTQSPFLDITLKLNEFPQTSCQEWADVRVGGAWEKSYISAFIQLSVF